jgi:hypothetical protein
MRAADGGQTQMERATGQRSGEGTGIEVGEHVIRDRALPARQLGGFPLPNHRWTRLAVLHAAVGLPRRAVSAAGLRERRRRAATDRLLGLFC